MNIISKTAHLRRNQTQIRTEVGQKGHTKLNFDENIVLGDNTALRLMYTHRDREFDQRYKWSKFYGYTIEAIHRINNRTQFRVHAENGKESRSLIGGVFKLGKGNFHDFRIQPLLSRHPRVRGAHHRWPSWSG